MTDWSEASAALDRVLAMIDGPDSHRRTVAAIVAFVNRHRDTLVAALRPEPGLQVSCLGCGDPSGQFLCVRCTAAVRWAVAYDRGYANGSAAGVVDAYAEIRERERREAATHD